MILNPYTPPAEIRALLGPEIDAACQKVDALAARLDAARERANEYGPRAERPDAFHLAAVRAAVAEGGSSADVPDERAAWVDAYRQATEDQSALRPLLDVAWRDLRDAIRAHGPAAVPAVEDVVTRAAADYRAALDAAAAAEPIHRQAMTVRRWIETADRHTGPDPFKPERETTLTVGSLRATPSEALALLNADAAALDTLHEQERKDDARRAYEAAQAAKVTAAAEVRERQEQAAAERLAAQRAATREKEAAKIAAREAAAVPGTPAA